MRIHKWMAVALTIGLLLCLVGCRKNDAPAGNSGASQPAQNIEVTKAAESQQPMDDGLYTVTFYSNDGTILKMESVEPHADATPPVEPQMAYGTVFVAWDSNFTDVTGNLDIHPLCVELADKPNVFAVSSAYGRIGETVVVPVRLCGDVCVSGFDITITYDADKIELKSVMEDGSVIYNDENPGEIRLNYVSAENTIADVDVCFLQFVVLEDFDFASISVEINDIYAFNDSVESQDDSMYIPGANIIDGRVYLIQ